MYVNVVFVIRCLYSAVSLTLVKEQRFRIIIIIIIKCIFSVWGTRKMTGDIKCFKLKKKKISAASVNHTPATRVGHNDTSHGLGLVLGCRGGGGDAGDEGPAAAAEHRADAGGRLGLGGPGEPRPGDANPPTCSIWRRAACYSTSPTCCPPALPPAPPCSPAGTSHLLTAHLTVRHSC